MCIMYFNPLRNKPLKTSSPKEETEKNHIFLYEITIIPKFGQKKQDEQNEFFMGSPCVSLLFVQK